jgi:hypothetical protein
MFSDPEIVIPRDNHIFSKMCKAIVNQDWVYVHGLVALFKQEQKMSRHQDNFTIINGHVLFKGTQINQLIGTVIMDAVQDTGTQPTVLHDLNNVLLEIERYLDQTMNNDLVVDRGIEEASEEEMFATLQTSEDQDNEEGSWGSWSGDESWGSGEDGIPGGVDDSDNTNTDDMLEGNVHLDGGSFISSDIERLTDEFKKNSDESVND